MKMKVVIQLKNGRQDCIECTCAYPIGDKVHVSEVLHYADGKNAINNYSFIGKIVHVELLEYNLEGFEYLDDGKKIGVIHNGKIESEVEND